VYQSGVESLDFPDGEKPPEKVEKNRPRSEVFLLTETKHSTATPWRHSRPAVLTLLALAVAVAALPLILAIDAAWVIGWSDGCLLLFAVAAALKCFVTTRRLCGLERIAWIFISLAYFLYALAEAIWATYEVILDVPIPNLSASDVGYMIAPVLLIVGIWLYRTSNPTLPAVIIQLGNAGILVATIFLANMIAFQQLLEVSGLSLSFIAYAVIGAAAFLFALFNICFYMRGRRRLVMMPLLFALGSLAVANYMTVYEVAADIYTSTSNANIGYFFTFAFGYWAAFEQDHLKTAPEEEQGLQAFDEVAQQWETLLLPLAIAVLMAVALIWRENLTADLIPQATGALLLFSAGLAIRDWCSQRVEGQLREGTRRNAVSLRESEQRLLAKNEELASANRELSKEMIARKHIEGELRHSHKMEAIGQLTGGVAHDFNNLLAVIIGNVDLLEQTLEPDSSQRAYTQEATAAANRGAALTERLLAFSRKQALDPRPIGVNDLLKSMTALFERTLGETIQLRFEIDADVAPCMVDRAQLENAILNLVINARDAMNSGGVITIGTSNTTLHAHDVAEYPEAEAGDYVSIAVRDTGTGMRDQVRARAFEPFFTTKEVGAGSGLGLSMVYGFVKQSGGQVSIESEEGSGTEVRLYLPQTSLLPDPIEGVDTNSAPTGRRESLLVVEDDPALRKVIVAFLSERNYQVAAAPDGSEALEILDESGPFDLLLSDIILPGEFSGQELANEVTRRQPSIKILLMSGYASDAFEDRARPADYANLLQKPFSMGSLARKIRSVLKAEGGDDSNPN
jgi:signal transduction histidine kinase/ActR/RegA family two-component response regulator